jgi:hypothetical protein
VALFWCFFSRFGPYQADFIKEKPFLQSKFFPAKIPVSKIQKKNLAG